jgi:cytochrome c oxidase subunit 2
VHNSLEEYEKYLSEKAVFTGTPEEYGRMLYDKKGCNACHSLDGSTKTGPSWKIPGEWGREITLQTGGAGVKMDENYVRESIESPQAKSKPGFPPSMPSFAGQLKEPEMQGLIAFIKSLKQ